MNWNNFSQGSRCPTCCDNNKKRDIEFVRKEFLKKGFLLSSTYYINGQSSLWYVCRKGHRNQTTWNRFQQGSGCPTCCESSRRTIEDVRECFTKRGYCLLSTKFVNVCSKLDYKCSQGHKGSIRLSDFLKGVGCLICYRVEHTWTIEEIKTFFEQQNYRLISTEYIGTSKLEYECPKGHYSQVVWSLFYRGCRCPTCCESKGEKQLSKILICLFPNNKIRSQDNLNFLGRQKVDFSVRDLKLAFEYDGEHHFHPVQFNGMPLKRAKRIFQYTVERDQRKNETCRKQGYRIIRFKYDEKLTLEDIRQKVAEVGKNENCI